MSRLPVDSPLNRRQFLGSSAKNAAGVAAGVVSLSAAATLAHSPHEKIRLGFIGARNQGKELAASFASLPDACISAVCDVDESVLPAAVKTVEMIGENNQPVGKVDVVTNGTAMALDLTMSYGLGEGDYDIVLTRAGAPPTTLDTVHVVGGRAEWKGTVPAISGPARLTLKDSMGRPRCSAALPTV